MTKRKVRTLIILAACFIVALLVAILPYKSSVDTKAYDLTLNVFSSRKMELEEGARLAETSSYSDERKGLRVTGKNGSYVGMKETVAGKFDMTWAPENGLSAVTYTFENADSKESFDLVVTFGNLHKLFLKITARFSQCITGVKHVCHFHILSKSLAGR